MKNKTASILLLLTVAAGFLAGIVHLFHLRFQAGDIYPAYSSLRSDPLGSKVMYEGLDSIRGVSAVRNYTPLDKIRHDAGTTYLLLGMHIKDFSSFGKEEAERLEAMAGDGAQIVMTFLPWEKSAAKCRPKKEKSCKKNHESGQNTADDTEQMHERTETDHDKDGPVSTVDLEERWGAGFEFPDSGAPAEYGSMKSFLITHRYPLPDSISWHSRSFFITNDSTWNVIYAVDGRPVLVEREFGKGKIILATDTYFASNEAMLKERYPDLLSWIIGSNRRVLFDETHFGIVEQPNLAALARKYRLHGMFAALLFLAVLFIWKNSVSLVPAERMGEPERTQEHSKDNLSGLVNLLRRTVKGHDIMNVCFHEWVKSLSAQRNNSIDLQSIEKIIEQHRLMPEGRSDALKSYESICQILNKRSLV